MAIGAPYATLAQLKLRIGESTTNNDAAITNALASATLSIEGWCGRQFNDAGGVSARVYYPTTSATVEVDDFSTTTGLIVAVDTDDTASYALTLTAAQYQVEPLNGIYDSTPGWPFSVIRLINTVFPISQHAPVKVTAQWGWAAVPTPVVEACLLLAELTFKLKDAPFGVAGTDMFGVVRVRENPQVTSLLTRYNPGAVA